MPRYEITSPDGRRFEITAPEGATQDQVLAYAKEQSQIEPQQQSGPPRQPNQAAMNPEVDTPFGKIQGETSGGFSPAAALIQAGGAADAINRGITQAKWGPVDWAREKMGLKPTGISDALKASDEVARQPMADLKEVHPGSVLIGDMALAGAAPWRALPALAAAEYGNPEDRLLKAGVTAVGGKLAQKSGEVVGRAVREARAAVDPLLPTGRAARIMQSAATNPEMAAQNIATAKPLIPGQNYTAAELANDSGLSSLQKSLRNQNPAAFSDFASQQDAVRQAYLNRAFGSQSDVNAAIAARETATAPLRQQALANANQTGTTTTALEDAIRQKGASKVGALQDAGQMQTTAAQLQGMADNFAPVPGMPRVPSSLSPNVERIPEFSAGAKEAAQIATRREAERKVLQSSLDAMPYAPLKAAPIVGSIEKALDVPGQRASDVVTKTLGSVKEKIAKLADENGIIDARDLYTVRKEIGNTVQTFAKESSNWDKRLTSGLERDIQRKIDGAILRAGGREWPQYLRQYSDLSKKIEGMQLGQDIMSKAINPQTEKMSPAAFLRQFQNRGEDIAGAGANVSLPLSNVAADLRRSVGPEAAMRTPGSDTAQNLLASEMMRYMPSLAGRAGRMAMGPLDRRTQAKLLSGSLSPEAALGLLRHRIPEYQARQVNPALPYLAGLLGYEGTR